jgi:hypothetical protein
MRYLRGGVLSNVEYNQLTDEEKYNQLAILQAAHKEGLDNMTPEDLAAYNKMLDEEDEEDDEHDGGGRRRYHRRKQSKSRSRKH